MHKGLLYVVATSGLYFSTLGVVRWRVNKSFNMLLLNDKLSSFSALKISSLHLRKSWVNTIPDRRDYVQEHDGVRLVFDSVIVSVALQLAIHTITNALMTQNPINKIGDFFWKTVDRFCFFPPKISKSNTSINPNVPSQTDR
jgi:hypothetical protein